MTHYHVLYCRLKILLDRALDSLPSEELTAILTGCGWHIQDYQRGYKLKVRSVFLDLSKPGVFSKIRVFQVYFQSVLSLF